MSQKSYLIFFLKANLLILNLTGFSSLSGFVLFRHPLFELLVSCWKNST